MSITELQLDTREIALTFSMDNLSALRAKFMNCLDDHSISMDTYHELNRQIRDRSDWLMNRRNK